MKLHPVAILCLLVALSVAIALTGLAHAQEPPPDVPATLRVLEAMPVHTTDADEDPDDRHERLRAIAEAIDAATGKRAERAWLLMTARRESGLARYVDRDEDRCIKGPRCDSGRAYSLWQLHDTDRTLSRHEAASEALKRMHRGARYCISTRGRDGVESYWHAGTSAYATSTHCAWPEAKPRVREMWVIHWRLGQVGDQ